MYEALNFFDNNLDLELNEKGAEDIEYRLISQKHLRSIGVGHGSAITAIIDTVIGTMVLSQVFQKKK